MSLLSYLVMLSYCSRLSYYGYTSFCGTLSYSGYSKLPSLYLLLTSSSRAARPTPRHAPASPSTLPPAAAPSARSSSWRRRPSERGTASLGLGVAGFRTSKGWRDGIGLARPVGVICGFTLLLFSSAPAPYAQSWSVCGSVFTPFHRESEWREVPGARSCVQYDLCNSGSQSSLKPYSGSSRNSLKYTIDDTADIRL